MEGKMIRRLVFALLAVLTAALASAQPAQNYTFLRSPEGRPTFGSGLRPIVTANMGIPVGTPFYDTSTYSLYYWDGSAWTASAAAGGAVTGTATLASGASLILCNTADCVTNYERFSISWSGNNVTIGTTAGGTGSVRSVTTAGAWYVSQLYPGVSDSTALGASSAPFSAINVSRAIQGGKSKSLTDAGAAVSFVRIAVPTNGYIGGKLIFTANSTDGTDRLTTSGEYFFAGADTAGTVTCGTPQAVGTPATAYRRVNTLVCAVTAVTSTTNCDLQVTCTDNLAGNQTMAFEWRLDMPLPTSVTPQ
jgi:hypothetical protein